MEAIESALTFKSSFMLIEMIEFHVAQNQLLNFWQIWFVVPAEYKVSLYIVQ